MSKELKYLLAIIVGVFVIVFAGFKLFMQDQPNVKPLATPSFPMISNLVTNYSFSYGPADAKVTVVEYFDPECESCAAVSPSIKKEMKHYEGKVRWVFRYMPYHFNSKAAILALESARKQNLFLEAMELLFKTQKEWGEKQVDNSQAINKIIFTLKGLDQKKYLDLLNDQEVQANLLRDETEGKQAGVNGTPTFYVNGVIIEELNLDTLIARIESELKK